jgi:G3E family GTPase
VANKIDLADANAIELFHQWGKNITPKKSLIAQTTQGQLDAAWLDLPRNPQRHASFTHTDNTAHYRPTEGALDALNHKADHYQSFGQRFPAQHCFDFEQLQTQLSQLNAERIKGILNTSQGWFIINGSDGQLNYQATSDTSANCIEIIIQEDQLADLSTILNHCRVDDNHP